MIFDLPPTTYIAQVYNCDVYGAAAYNECPESSSSSTPEPSSTSSNSSLGTSTQNTTSNDNSVIQEESTPTTPSPQFNLKPAPSPEKEITLVTPANTIAGLDWTVIVPISLVLSVLVALIVLMFKRHRRNQAY